MKNEYTFIAVLEYADDGINITFPDLPGCISCADVNATEDAVKNAKDYISGALAAMLDLGKGSGPLAHNYAII